MHANISQQTRQYFSIGSPVPTAPTILDPLRHIFSDNTKFKLYDIKGGLRN